MLSRSTHALVRLAILLYWTLFWLFNLIDKAIGGAHFLWVGRDRFAQFQKYFASTGLDNPDIANAALLVAAALESFAFVFFAGALLHFLKGHASVRSWAFAGTLFTLGTFTFFSIGDHWFGDRFELLEHTLFWFISLVSWVLFTRLEDTADALPVLPRRPWVIAGLLAGTLILVTTTAIFRHNANHFFQRTAPIAAEPVGDHLYKVTFPFLGGSAVFERSIAQFQQEHPDEMIDHIYTVPDPLRLKKADALIFYIATQDRP